MGDPRKKIRTTSIRRKKEKGEKIVMITAHDALSAGIVAEAELDMVLVGDSLGMTSLGFSNTLEVTMEMMIHHAAAVARASIGQLLVGDMPFMSYKISREQALTNAARLIQEGRMEGVKLEGGAEIAGTVAALVQAGIPVMGHVGLMPQSFHAQGGFRVQGRDGGAAERLLADSKALDEAGAFAIVLEAMPPSIARRITESVSAATIGIGAGAGCDGQVLVFSDLLGLTAGRMPKFARRYAELRATAIDALKQYGKDVREKAFPAEEHTYPE